MYYEKSKNIWLKEKISVKYGMRHSLLVNNLRKKIPKTYKFLNNNMKNIIQPISLAAWAGAD